MWLGWKEVRIDLPKLVWEQVLQLGQGGCPHMGPEHASRGKNCTMVNFFIFVQKNISRIRFQEIKIGP